jgi:hypothetical protein
MLIKTQHGHSSFPPAAPPVEPKATPTTADDARDGNKRSGTGPIRAAAW